MSIDDELKPYGYRVCSRDGGILCATKLDGADEIFLGMEETLLGLKYEQRQRLYNKRLKKGNTMEEGKQRQSQSTLHCVICGGLLLSQRDEGVQHRLCEGRTGEGVPVRHCHYCGTEIFSLDERRSLACVGCQRKRLLRG